MRNVVLFVTFGFMQVVQVLVVLLEHRFDRILAHIINIRIDVKREQFLLANKFVYSIITGQVLVICIS